MEESATIAAVEPGGDDIPDWLKGVSEETIDSSQELSEKTSSEAITPSVKEEEGQKD